MNWYLEVLRKYAVFEGRARRKEYWMFVLFNFLILVLLLFIEMTLEMAGYLRLLYGLAVFVPSIAVAVRRLHDIGRTGWWYLIGLIPLVGVIVLIVFFATDGDRGPNRYGPDPKGAPEPPPLGS